MRRLALPIQGAESVRTFKDGRPGFAPVDRLRNVRTFSPVSGRPQIGKRHGWRRLVQQRLSTLPVQAIRECPRSSYVTGYTLGDAAPITSGDSREAAAITGNYWLLDSVPSLTRDLFLNVNVDGGPLNNTVNAVSARKDLQGYPPYGVVAVASTFLKATTGLTRVRVQLVRTDTQAVIATYTIASATENLYCNSIRFGREFLYVCGSKLWVLNAADLTLMDTFDIEGWASDVVACDTYVVDEVEYLYVAFNGSNVGGQPYGPQGLPPVGTIVGGHPSIHFRAGVRKYRVDETHLNPSGPYYQTRVLEVVPFGQYFVGLYGDNAADTFYEGDHLSFRISERSVFKPRGCLLKGISVSPIDGTVVVIRTNTGYGPDNTYTPDLGLTGRVTVSAITPGFASGDNGTMLWEADVGSVVEIGLNGFYNDILNPTLAAVSVDPSGRLLVAGRQNAAAKSLWRMNIADGALEQAANLESASGKIICAAADPTDGTVWFGGGRNNAWDGSGGANAHLWKVRASDLTIPATFDLAAVVSGLSVAVTPAGEVVYGTDKV